jgi:hypothetical protein
MQNRQKRLTSARMVGRSVLGQTRTSWPVQAMSASPPKPDVRAHFRTSSFGPFPDSCSAQNTLFDDGGEAAPSSVTVAQVNGLGVAHPQSCRPPKCGGPPGDIKATRVRLAEPQEAEDLKCRLGPIAISIWLGKVQLPVSSNQPSVTTVSNPGSFRAGL